MIKEITIKNFQGFEDAKIELHEGVNIFRGKSHKGKSSIHRAIKWALRNKPKGDSFKNWFAKTKDPVSVNIDFDDSWITRLKGPEGNQYITKDDPPEAPLSAIGTDVPSEVEAITKMDDTNIHSQHDGFFWLDKNISPGKVAQELNKTVGLDIIDKALAESTQIINRSNRVVDTLSLEIKNDKEELKKFDGLNDIDELIKSIDKSLNSLDIKSNEERDILDLIESINSKQADIDELDNWLEVTERHKKLKIKVYRQKRIQNKIDKLSDIVDRINACKERIQSKANLPSETKGVKRLIRKVKKRELESRRYYSIRKLVSEIATCKNMIFSTGNFIEEQRTKFDKMLKETGQCPLCLRKF